MRVEALCFGMEETLNKIIKDAKEWATKNLRGKKVYCSILKEYVSIGKMGIDHTLYYNRSKIKAKVLYKLENYIKRASEMIVVKDKNNLERRVYKLSVKGMIDKNKYKIYLIIKENERGKFYYDGGIIKKADRTE